MNNALKYYLDGNYCLVLVKKVGNQFDLIEFFTDDDNCDWYGMTYLHDEIILDDPYEKEISKNQFMQILKNKLNKCRVKDGR